MQLWWFYPSICNTIRRWIALLPQINQSSMIENKTALHSEWFTRFASVLCWSPFRFILCPILMDFQSRGTNPLCLERMNIYRKCVFKSGLKHRKKHAHHKTNTFISSSAHSLVSAHIHQWTYTFISERTHSSVSVYIHQWGYAFIQNQAH